MTGRKYIIWFGGVVAALFLIAIGFNIWAERYILSHPAFGSVQLMSGFERVLKPAWLDTVKPQWVFVGSSRMREGFDPSLIEARYGVRSFNYGVSSITAYETRRFVQDAAAQKSVKTIFVSLDSFTAGSEAAPISSGFDEYRLAVKPDGAATPYRNFWLTMSRYVSGGALGMHAYSVSLLAQLGSKQTAAHRPDLFAPYKGMDLAFFKRDLGRRHGRSMALTRYQRGELRKSLAAVCRPGVRMVLFFPPDHFAVITRYLQNDLAAFEAFKREVIEDVRAHNLACGDNVRLFDYLFRNALTLDPITAGRPSQIHVDLVHFRPPVGLMLLDDMLHPQSHPLGADLLAPLPTEF